MKNTKDQVTRDTTLRERFGGYPNIRTLESYGIKTIGDVIENIDILFDIEGVSYNSFNIIHSSIQFLLTEEENTIFVNMLEVRKQSEIECKRAKKREYYNTHKQEVREYHKKYNEKKKIEMVTVDTDIIEETENITEVDMYNAVVSCNVEFTAHELEVIDLVIRTSMSNNAQLNTIKNSILEKIGLLVSTSTIVNEPTIQSSMCRHSSIDNETLHKVFENDDHYEYLMDIDFFKWIVYGEAHTGKEIKEAVVQACKLVDEEWNEHGIATEFRVKYVIGIMSLPLNNSNIYKLTVGKYGEIFPVRQNK